MADAHSEAMWVLESLEHEQIERYRPKPQEPRTPAEEFAKRLDAAQGRYLSVDSS